jgi:hypothetical protein
MDSFGRASGGRSVVQRLKQHNKGARLLLNPDDFLFARETPRCIGGVVRHIRRRIDRAGFAELSVHESERGATRFCHYWTEFGQEQMGALSPALLAAQQAMAGVPVGQDPNGVYRRLEFWVGESPVTVSMEDFAGTPRFDAPAFEAAWRLVVQQFPVVEDRK